MVVSCDHFQLTGHVMLIAQISDIHIAGGNRLTYGIAPMAENLARCIAHINQLSPQPDLVMVTGDICDTGTIEECERAAALLDALHAPYYVIPGNHDRRKTLWATFHPAACPAPNAEFINYVIEGHPLRLIAMDSIIPGAPGGELCTERLAWLDSQLGAAPDQPTIIFLHHPPVDCSIRETRIDGFIGAADLGAIVAKYNNIERIACGHIHLLIHSRWHNTLVTTAPSMGLQLDLDLNMEKPNGFVLADPGYLLHHWTDAGALITHAIAVRDLEGPFPFENQPET